MPFRLIRNFERKNLMDSFHPVETYVYSPLNQERQEIRLAVLKPSPGFNDEIHLTLQVVSILDKKLHYEAVSYVWGDPDITSPVQLGSFSWQVTTNLATCLRYLRHRAKVRTLWVDALCINQSNAREKSAQVAIMHKIYSEATIVRAWIGSPDSSSIRAFRFLRKFEKDGNPLEKQTEGLVINDKDFEDMTSLISRPWWTRLWVQQEIMLAKKASFHCGHARVNRSVIEALGKLITMYTTENLRPDDISQAARLRFEDSSIAMFPITAALRYRTNLREDNQLSSKLSAAQSFFFIMTFGSLLKCSDPRDRVYGFLSLAPANIRHGIVPNYNSAPEDVYQEFSERFICNHGSLSFLNGIRFRPKSDRVLSTWVRDWRLPGDTFQWCQTQFMTYRVLEFNAKVVKKTLLKINGVFIDGIAKILELRRFELQDFRKKRQEWRAFFGLQAQNRDETSYIGGGIAEDACWATLCHGKRQSRRVYASEIRDFGVSAHCNALTVGENDLVEQLYLDLVKSIQSIVPTHSLFLSKRGYFCIGSSEAEVGDMIYALAGGDMCSVLRPATTSEHFELVGHAYVHGLMNGEAASGLGLTMYNRTLIRDFYKEPLAGDDAANLDPELPRSAWQDVYLV